MRDFRHGENTLLTFVLVYELLYYFLYRLEKGCLEWGLDLKSEKAQMGRELLKGTTGSELSMPTKEQRGCVTLVGGLESINVLRWFNCT